MLSYHNDQSIKDFYLARVRAHAEADELIHGVYWQDGTGCAVGCTVHSGSHAAYEKELGIPRLLARLEDGIFEGMANGRSKQWPEQFLSAITVGRDLSLVWPRFAVWLMTDARWGMLQYAKNKASKKAIQDVADAYQSVVNGEKKEIDWYTLRSAAYAAYAADAAAYAAYAAYAADAAAYAAAVRFSKRQECREAQADKLLDAGDGEVAYETKTSLLERQGRIHGREIRLSLAAAS